MKKTITRRSFLKKSSKIVAATGLGGCGILLKGCTLKKYRNKWKFHQRDRANIEC
jgi:hypothetical protein